MKDTDSEKTAEKPEDTTPITESDQSKGSNVKTESSALEKPTQGKARNVPSDLEQTFIVTRYEILRFVRGWRLIGLLLLTLIVALVVWILPIALDVNTSKDPLGYASSFTGFVGILVILSVTLFGADSIVGEFQNKTAYAILPNPVRRESVFFGKYIASTICAFIVTSVYYAVAAIATVASTHGMTIHLGQSFLLALFYTASAMTVAFLISALMKGTTSANVLTFFLFFLIFNIVDSLLAIAGVKPWGSLTFAGGTLNNIMSSPYPTDTVQILNGGSQKGGEFVFHTYYSSLSMGIAVMLAYAIVCGFLALFLFRRRETKD